MKEGAGESYLDSEHVLTTWSPAGSMATPNRKKGERRFVLSLSPISRSILLASTRALAQEHFYNGQRSLMFEQISPTTPRMQSNLTKSFSLFLANGERVERGKLMDKSGEPIREDKIGKVVWGATLTAI